MKLEASHFVKNLNSVFDRALVARPTFKPVINCCPLHQPVDFTRFKENTAVAVLKYTLRYGDV
jgi:hypothetical protein